MVYIGIRSIFLIILGKIPSAEMKTIALLLVFAASASAVDLTEFHVKWKLVDPNRTDSYYALPTTVDQAIDGNWIAIESANMTTAATPYCQPNDPRLCVLMDSYGNICGIQIGLPISEVGDLHDLMQEELYTSKTILDTPCWTCTAYFVDPDVIDAGGREDCNNITATGDFWFERNDGDYNYVPRNLSDIPSNYVKEACYEGMGQHYFPDLHNTTLCPTISPWSMLYDGDQTSGIIFESFGTMNYTDIKWFETVYPFIIKAVFPTAPDCMVDWTASPGAITLHMYFNPEPWNYVCPS